MAEAHTKNLAIFILQGNNVTEAGEVGRINVRYKALVGLLKLRKADDLSKDNLSVVGVLYG